MICKRARVLYLGETSAGKFGIATGVWLLGFESTGHGVQFSVQHLLLLGRQPVRRA